MTTGPGDPLPPYGTPPESGTPPRPSATAELPQGRPAAAQLPAWATSSAWSTSSAPAGRVAPSGPAGPLAPAPGGPRRSPRGGHRSTVAAIRTLGILVTLLLVAGGTAGMVVQFFSRSETTTTTVTGTVTRLVTDTTVGDLRVRVGRAGDPVTVQERLRWSFGKPTVTRAPVVDGVLQITTHCSSTWFDTCSADLDVTVPPGTELQVRTVSGDVNADVRDAPANVHAVSGGITLAAAGSERVVVETSSGDVRVRNDRAAAHVDARSTSGDVQVVLTAVPSEVTARTTSGDVTVTLPPAADGYQVDTQTSLGDVTLNPPALRNDRATGRLTAHTTTGDVTITAR